VKSVLLVILSTLLIMGCSSKPAKTTTIDDKDDKTAEKKTAIVYDIEKPTSFAEYKKWRQANDPASEAYARYKEWEISHRRWLLEQEK
jgi:PBP1b-binding outer membrane lipoprotein LpoB